MSQIIKAYGGAFVMLDVTCPLCGKAKSMTLLRFIQAINVNEQLCCGDCDTLFEIKVSCLTRDAQLRNEAVDAGQDVAETCDCGEPFPEKGYCEFCGAHARYATS